MISKCTVHFSRKILPFFVLAGIQLSLSIQVMAATTCTDENVTLNNDNAAIGSIINYRHTQLDTTKPVVIKFDGNALPAITPIRISSYHDISTIVPGSIKKLQTVVDLEVDGKLVCSSTLKILPKITSVTPNNSNIGDIVTISGNGFDLSNINNNIVTFNGIKAELRGFNGNDILAVTPQSVTGPIQVETSSGKSDERAVQTISSLAVSGVTPNQAPIDDIIEISGGNFDSTCIVKINNVQAEIISVSPKKLLAKVPATTSGTLTVDKGAEKSFYQGQFKVITQLVVKSSDDNKLSPGSRRKLFSHTPGFYIKEGISSQHFAPARSTLKVTSEEDKDANITVIFAGVGEMDKTAPKPFNCDVVSEETAYVIKASKLFTEYPSKGYGFTSGVLTVPYKYYPNMQELSGQPTVNGYLGYKIESLSYELSFVASAGIGVVPITTTNTSNGSGASFSAAWGAIMSVNKNFQVGIVHGWDWADKSSNYKYQGKPWIAVSFGTAIY